MNRKQTILAVILAVQVVFLVVLKGPFSSAAATASTVQPFLPRLEKLAPTRLAIKSGEGKEVALRLKGDAWTLADMDDYPVDGSKVDTMLKDLRQLKVRRPVVTSSRFHDQLKVGDSDFERRVRIWDDAEGEPAVDFLVGNSPNYRVSDVRREGDDDVYEVMGLSSWDLQADAGSWIDKKLVDVPPDEVTGLMVKNGNGTFQLEKVDGAWTVKAGAAAGKLDQGAVDSLVRAYAALYLADPVGHLDAAAQGLDKPAAEIQLIRAGKQPPAATAGDEASTSEEKAPVAPQVTTLEVGGEVDTDSGKRYATVTGFGFAVTLNKFDAERATDKKLSDLIEEKAPKG